MSYESWRISFQSSEQAARAAYAEVEALRAEVERLRADRDSWEQQASGRLADWHAEHLRAERLVEASRQLVSMYERATGLPCPPQLRRALAACRQRGEASND